MMRLVRRALAIWGTLMLAGCLSRVPLESPSQDGARWIELSSPHFTLATDLEGDEATLVIRTFELAYALLARVVFGAGDPPDFQTEVIAFRSKSELQEFLPDRFGGQYIKQLPSDLQPSPTLVIYGELSPESRKTFAHELTHRFEHVALGSMPVWLNEGLAQFYATIRGDLQHPEVGAVDTEHGFKSGALQSEDGYLIDQRLLPSDLPTASKLMDLEPSQFYLWRSKDKNTQRRDRDMSANYSAAWALVHMLMTTGSPNAVRFRQVLREAARIHNATAALDRIAFDDDALDKQFTAYVLDPQPWQPRSEGAPPALGGIQQRTLSDAQTLVRWARLSSIVSERGARYLRAAAAMAPTDPEVQFWLGRFNMLNNRRQEAERLFKAALAQDPNNPGYQLALLALQLGGQGQRRWASAPEDEETTHAMDRLSKVAHTATELITVATYRLLENRAEVALPLAERATRVDPDCWLCFHVYALAVSRTGDVPRALTLERNAWNRLPEETPAGADMAVRAALNYFKTTTVSPAAAAPAPTLFFPW
jgi:tetratricopeptide (TPR) repeat protein